jgi:TonB-linked SusC/RagA family outer membrane protein
MTSNAEESSPEQIVIEQSVQQNRKIAGTVIDENGEALVGASVVVKGTNIGTGTDLNGAFSLEVPKDAVLVVKYLGYTTFEVAVGNQDNLSISLTPDNSTLDEVVVVGYGTMKRRDLTGAISSVKATDMERVSSSNAMQVLQARVPGLDIRQSDGQAGSSLSMTLRGNRSISASNSPLVLVDGIEYGSTIDINASDIESMEILKDASSTAIYGTKGANGVIIITTKRGTAGKTRVNFNTYLSSNIPTSYVHPLYGQREVDALIAKQNYSNDIKSGNWGSSNVTAEEVLGNVAADHQPVGHEFTVLDVYKAGDYTDWLDIILRNGLTQNYEASVSGGNENTNFNASLGAMYEEGLMKNDNLDRYNGKLTLDHKVSKHLKVGVNMMYAYRTQNQRNSSVFSQALKMSSITRPYNYDGSILTTPNAFYKAHSSPLLDEVPGNWQRNIESTRFFGNAYIEISPIKNLQYKSLLAVNRTNTRSGRYQDFESVSRLQSPTTSAIENVYSMNTGFTWDNTLNYSITLGKNEISAMLGTEATQNVSENMTVSGDAGQEHYYVSSFYDVSKVGSIVPTSDYIKQSMLSYFGRLNYVYGGKYILGATIRRDGSSTLAKGHKWGNFPSLSAGWRIIDESFMEGTKNWLSNLKLRASWGVSGNAAVDAYGTLAGLSDQNLYYWMGGKDVVGKIPSLMGNENLKWETTSAFNFGLDFGFLNNRISGSIEYYISKTSDLIFLKTSPASSVFTSVIDNIGDSKGNGLEVALNTLVVKNKNYSYDINWSYSTNKDEITGLADGILKYQESGDTWRIVGKPVRIFYGYESAGTWNVGEFDAYKTAWESRHPGESMAYVANYGTPGTFKMVDRNDDGKLDNDDKKVYQRTPKHIFGMNNTFTYQNLSLSILLYARIGGYMSYGLNGQTAFEPQWANWGDIDYWVPDGKSHPFPSPGAISSSTGGSLASVNGGEYKTASQYEKADYFKIKDITLSYRFPKIWMNKLGINDVKVYGSLKNFFSFSAVGDYDAERDGSISFPLAKQAVIGLNFQF